MLFNQEICVTGTRSSSRKIAATLPACVVDDGVPSDSIEGHLVATCDRFTFFIRAFDWPDVTPPQIGDSVLHGDSQFKVTRVARLADCFSLNARSR